MTKVNHLLNILIVLILNLNKSKLFQTRKCYYYSLLNGKELKAEKKKRKKTNIFVKKVKPNSYKCHF